MADRSDASQPPAADSVLPSPDFRQVFDHAPALLLLLAPDAPRFTILGATDAYLKATQTRREAITGRPLFDLFPDNPDDRDATGATNLRASLDTVLTTRAAHTMAVQKYDIRDPAVAGGRFVVRYWAPVNSPVLDDDGRVQAIVHRVEDVTDLELAKKTMRRDGVARDEAVAASRAKDDFFAVLSHELRTPLNPVLLVASESAADPALPAEVRGDFQMISDNISLQARLIDDLLDFNRVIHGKVTLEKRPLSLHDVVRAATVTIQEEISAKRIGLTFALLARVDTVQGDPVRLRQVFWNVLKNAVKFTPAGGRIEITSPELSRAAAIELRIRDSGIGMSARELKQIFHPFVQGGHAVDEHQESYGGLGLGLALSRMLVELHGGTLAAESAGPGRGATIIVRLPLHVASGRHHPADGVNGHSPAGSPPHRTQRVLFVEDHEPTRTAMARLLKRRGYDVSVAHSVQAGLEQARDSRFDVVISDLGLPDGDGCELMIELKKSHPDIRGIALSGYGMDGDLTRSRHAGFSDHLIKPVSVDSLDRAMTRLLERDPAAPRP
jgi:signal transduction histidine kinase/ActR/RegA family two-component response regulator